MTQGEAKKLLLALGYGLPEKDKHGRLTAPSTWKTLSEQILNSALGTCRVAAGEPANLRGAFTREELLAIAEWMADPSGVAGSGAASTCKPAARAEPVPRRFTRKPRIKALRASSLARGQDHEE